MLLQYAKRTLLGLIILIVPWGSSCARFNPSELTVVCVRYVDSEGYLRGRTATFNTQGASRALRDDYSHMGPCVKGAQGPVERVEVCWLGVSVCGHDRTDEIDGYTAKRYEKVGRIKYGRCERYIEDDCIRANLDSVRTPDPRTWWRGDEFTVPSDGTALPPVPPGGLPPEKDEQ